MNTATTLYGIISYNSNDEEDSPRVVFKTSEAAHRYAEKRGYICYVLTELQLDEETA
jgi:hypothetical protein